MSEISIDRIDPTSPVIESQGPEPRGQSDSRSRRRRPAAVDEPETAESPEMPTHQIDRLA
jgi:hypothetical protein